jgi:hypothetical protein
MNPLDLVSPVTLPLRLVIRAADDLHTMAVLAGRVSDQIADLQERSEVVIDGIESLLRLGATIEKLGERVVDLGEQIDVRAGSLLGLGERIESQAVEILGSGAAIENAAREVASRGAEVAAALPTLQKAIDLAMPLEGAVERVGRLVDRLPGGAAARRRELDDERR